MASDCAKPLIEAPSKEGRQEPDSESAISSGTLICGSKVSAVVAWLPENGTTSSHLPSILNTEDQEAVGFKYHLNPYILPAHVKQNPRSIESIKLNLERSESSVLRVYPVQNGHIAKTIIKHTRR
jgi:hypothetical protein